MYWIELNHVVEHQLERVFHSLQDYSSTENVEINDIIHNFLAERKKAKNILTALVNDKINNESNTNPDQIEGKSNIYTRYQNLKNSKLGKLQIKYWNMRKNGGSNMSKKPQTKNDQLIEAVSLLQTDYLQGLSRLEETINASDVYTYLKSLEKMAS